MFNKLFKRETATPNAASATAATAAASAPVSKSESEQPTTQIQELLMQALRDAGVDITTLPSNWRQLVTSELLSQIRGPNPSFQIDPTALKTLLVQLSAQPARSPAPTSPAMPAAPATQTTQAAPAQQPMLTTSPQQQPASSPRRAHVDILQL
jgi:hypothetical protein